MDLHGSSAIAPHGAQTAKTTPSGQQDIDAFFPIGFRTHTHTSNEKIHFLKITKKQILLLATGRISKINQ